MAERTNPDGHGFTLTRVMEAPREDVWREWTTPDAFADWWGGAQVEVPLDTVSMDVREEGEWRATMIVPPERREINWRGSYHEVDEPERLVFTVTDEPDGDRFDLVTVVLNDLGDGRTEMVVEQRGWMEPDGYERAKQGWGGFLDRMAERLG